MKLDELEKMAKETAAFGVHPSGEYIYSFYTEQLQAFARLVAEHEREQCAKDCESINSVEDFYGERPELICAGVIRARDKHD
jgi:hypothetical protein